MKYKFLRLRIIVPSLIVIMLGILVLTFFVGGLKAASFEYDNLEWNEDGFVRPEMVIIDGNKKWLMNDVDINTRKYVTDNEKYVMYIDEDTTVISIYQKLEGWTKDDKTKEKLLYQTANTSSNFAEEKSNVTLYYYDSNGKLASLNSFDNSVKYENKLKGQDEKYYSLRYNNDGTLDILYQIGEFSNILETFPKYFTRTKFEELFVGNIMFLYTNDSTLGKKEIDVVGSDGNLLADKGYEMKIASKFTADNIREGADNEYGYALCFDNEAALYLIKNGLGTLHYKADDEKVGVKELTFKEAPSDENEILNAENGYWEVFNIVDETGTLKFKLGENCNCTSSPVKYNPFLTTSILDTITYPTFYPIIYETENDKGEKTTANTNYRDRANIENSYLEFKATEKGPSKELYQYLVIGSYGLAETNSSLPNYLIPNAEKPTMIKKYQSQIKTYRNKTVYFDYNNDGVITADEGFVYGGYQARDLQGNYLFIDENNKIFYFDANGNRMLNDDEGVASSVDSTGSYKPYQNGLTKDITEEENTKYNATSEAESKAFQLAIRFALKNDELDITLINNSLIEGVGKNSNEEVESYFKHDNTFAKIEMCKYMATNKSETEKGQIVLPDGSGAIISFNSIKDSQYAAKYAEKPIYGNDFAIPMETRGYDQQTLMFPMFGFVEQTSKKGIVAIVEKGAPQSSITANFKRKSSVSGIDVYNYAFFTTRLRSSESVKITANTSYTKVSDKLYSSDISYRYKFIFPEESGRFDYTTVASCYREYLINKYNLQEKVDTTKSATPTITFIGAYKKKQILLGVVYDAQKSLTTFNEANEIVNDLTDNGINSMNVNYSLWTSKAADTKISYKYKVNSVLGGKNDLKDFTKNVINKGYNMFLDYQVDTGYGYDMPFGSLKYNIKSIAGSTTNALEYVLSTGLADATGKTGGLLSPVFYNSIVTKYMKNYAKLETNGINLIGIGNANASDYSKSRQVYCGDGLEYQRLALQTAKDSGKKIMLDAPFDYAFEYVDVANNVPVETTLLQIVDYSIPLYQLVCSGLFDYSSKTINYNNDNSIEWNILKAIETGSNLYFEVSASDTSDLLETDYTSYYNSYYANWKEKIISMNKTLNETGIYNSRLVNHEYLNDNLVRVSYENGLTILINYSDSNYIDSSTGIAVRSNWYAVEKLGREE